VFTFFQVFRTVKQNSLFKEILIEVLLVLCAHNINSHYTVLANECIKIMLHNRSPQFNLHFTFCLM
jgi:hypothetical protein